MFFLNENSFSCLLCATSRRTKDEDVDDEKASLLLSPSLPPPPTTATAMQVNYVCNSIKAQSAAMAVELAPEAARILIPLIIKVSHSDCASTVPVFVDASVCLGGVN